MINWDILGENVSARKDRKKEKKRKRNETHPLLKPFPFFLPDEVSPIHIEWIDH